MVGRGAASAGPAVFRCIYFTYRRSKPTLQFFLHDLRERESRRRDATEAAAAEMEFKRAHPPGDFLGSNTRVTEPLFQD